MNAAVIAFSEKGHALGERLVSHFTENGDTAGLNALHARSAFPNGRGNISGMTRSYLSAPAVSPSALWPRF